MSGDVAQLPPTVTSMNQNEYYESERLSLFERLIRCGWSHVMLRTQYRMHSDIAHFVNTELYSGRLLNHASTNRQVTFPQAIQSKYGGRAGRSYFISEIGRAHV